MFYFDKKRFLYGLILGILFFGLFLVGFFVGKNQIVCQICPPEDVDFSLFWDAYNKLQENFINPGLISEEKVIYGAIAGMTKSLGDPYTVFFDPEQAKIFEQDLAGSFEGIGIEVAIRKDQLTVITPLKNTPSEKAGLQAGDIIVKINNQNASEISTEQAVRMIRGKKGTEVVLSVFREGWNQPKDFKIIRDTIKIEAVKWELKEKNIAYISINQFDQNLSNDFKNIVFDILKSPAQKIVLDLRNNPGGYLEVAQEIAGWFLEKGQLVAIEDFGDKKEKKYYKANGNAALVKYPTVVLINRGSASASEILAGAMRDNRNIKLIGEKSFGKGSVQEVVNLRDNSSFLKVTIAKWLTPKGNSITETGLMPDILVEKKEEDWKENKDPQLDKALEIILNLS